MRDRNGVLVDRCPRRDTPIQDTHPHTHTGRVIIESRYAKVTPCFTSIDQKMIDMFGPRHVFEKIKICGPLENHYYDCFSHLQTWSSSSHADQPSIRRWDTLTAHRLLRGEPPRNVLMSCPRPTGSPSGSKWRPHSGRREHCRGCNDVPAQRQGGHRGQSKNSSLVIIQGLLRFKFHLE